VAKTVRRRNAEKVGAENFQFIASGATPGGRSRFALPHGAFRPNLILPTAGAPGGGVSAFGTRPAFPAKAAALSH